jgi:sodium-dependent dicarboxylate transporter 2/3/5
MEKRRLALTGSFRNAKHQLRKLRQILQVYKEKTMSTDRVAGLATEISIVEVSGERRRRLIALGLGPLLFVIAVLAPTLPSVSELGMRTLGVFLWTAVWWFSEAIPIPATSLFALAMLVLAGILPVDAAFSTWSNWVILFLVGAFVIGHAMNVHGLTRRIAYHMVSSRLVQGNPWRVLLFFAFGSAVVSSILSHVVTTMIFLSIAVGLAKTLRFEKGSRYAEALFLSICWGSSFGIGTPVGAPTNLIAIGMAAQSFGYRVGFLEWMLVCIPMVIVGLAALFFVIRYVLKPETPNWQLSPALIETELSKLGPLSRGEKVSAGVFLIAMFLWILPDLLPLFLTGGRQHPISVWVTRHLDWSVTALIMATSLFVIPVDRKNGKYAMTWEEAVKGIEWGTLCLIAGALGLGNAIANKTTGLGTLLEQSISAFVTASGSEFLFVLGVITFTVIVGSFVSNLAIVGVVGALIQVIGPSAGVNPIALMIAVGVGANMDFALPIGTPYNAMVFASGYVRMGTMVKGGTVLSLLTIPLVSLLVFYLASWLIPWQP